MQIPQFHYPNHLYAAGCAVTGISVFALCLSIDLYLLGYNTPASPGMVLSPAIPAVIGLGLIFLGLIKEDM